MNSITPQNSPTYLTVKECQNICRFKGPEPIRRAVCRGELGAIKVRANRLLILASSFWEWFHQNDVNPKLNPKPKNQETPRSREHALLRQLQKLCAKL